MSKIKSYGTKVIVGGIPIGGLTEVKRSGASRNFPDITTHDSEGGYKEFVPGLKEGGTCELEGKFDIADPGQNLLRAGSDEKQNVIIELTDGTKIGFSAYIQPPTENAPLDDAVSFTASLKITGPLSYT